MFPENFTSQFPDYPSDFFSITYRQFKIFHFIPNAFHVMLKNYNKFRNSENSPFQFSDVLSDLFLYQIRNANFMTCIPNSFDAPPQSCYTCIFRIFMMFPQNLSTYFPEHLSGHFLHQIHITKCCSIFQIVSLLQDVKFSRITFSKSSILFRC